MRTILLSFTVLFISGCVVKESTPSYENEILWDSWGIPHIYANQESDLYQMMGWAQMKNHGDLILKLYGEGRAKSSEYWGDDPQNDILLHLTDVLTAAEKTWNNMPASDKAVVEAYVKGLNSYASKYPDQISEKYQKVLPVTAMDVMNHSSRAMNMEFLIRRNVGSAYRWTPGSNAWAVDGTKTASKKAMLLTNPHLPWEDLYLFFEAHLITPDNSLYGTTLVGLPTLGIAFNENLGWTHTVNTLDNVDIYEITISGNQYLLDGEYKDFEIDSVKVVTKKDGSSSEQWVVKKKSAFGMVLKESGDKAVAMKWANMEGEFNPLGQWKAMGEAQDINAFKNVLKQNGLPLFNVVYADKAGNILYHFGGNIPKKNGDWDKWQQIVATSSSDELWDGFYGADEVPSFTNPETGWIQNANDPPYTSTVPATVDPADFASHIAPNSMSFRPQRSARLIMDAQNLTLEDFITLKHDTRSELAMRLQDDFEELKSMTKDSLTLAALEVLTRWDASYDASSTGAILFMNIIRRGGLPFGDQWSFDDPINTPSTIGDPGKFLSSVKQIAQAQIDQLGALEVPYGDLFRLKVGEYEYPGNGGLGQLGIFRTMVYLPGDDGKLYSYHGDSYVCATEFGDKVKAKALMSYGNATQPGNVHVGDQLKLFTQKQLRDVWYSRADQEANLELVEKMEEM
ncbi:MAG: penicillin acylase family protein [Cytophagales bacterium]|nr:penicillin acylase family protein [Cytophagales bacterium]